MADSILESLLGEVSSNFNGNFDISEVISRAAVNSYLNVSPPRLILDGADEHSPVKKKERKSSKNKKEKHSSMSESKRKRRRSHSHEREHREKKLKVSEDSTKNVDRPWTFEPIPKMCNTNLDDLPLGADFRSIEPLFDERTSEFNIDMRRDVTKDGRVDSAERKTDEKKHSHRHKKHKKHRSKDKKSKKEEDDAITKFQPRSIAISQLPEKPSKVVELEEGEIVDGPNGGGWMTLNSSKSMQFENADDYLVKRLEKQKKKKKEKQAKEKEKESDEHRKNDKDRHRDDSKRSSSRSRHRDDHDSFPRSSGSLSRHLSPRHDGSSRSKILPSSWSKHINNLLQSSNKEFTRSSDSHRRDHERRRSSPRSYSRDRDIYHNIEKELPERQPRSRSASPVAGRGRNFFRRTDEEWREHQRDRIVQRRQRRDIPLLESEYTDRYNNIDKKKLIEIATKNVAKLAMNGALPKGFDLMSTIKHKPIQELVDFCKKLHDDAVRDRRGRNSDSDGEKKTQKREYDNTFCIKGVREHGATLPTSDEMFAVSYLEDGMPLQLMTDSRTNDTMLRLSFPVSSGIEHREKERDFQDDEMPDLPLVTALTKIKTNIPVPFVSSIASSLICPLKPTDIPSLPPLPQPLILTNSITSNKTTNVSSANNISGSITLDKPIEINMTNNGSSSLPVNPTPKPIVVRASFLRSGKKAAEAALKSILPPIAVPAVTSTTEQSTSESELTSNAKHSTMIVPIVEAVPLDVPKIMTPPETSPKEVTHSDALSAILDRVDQLINTGKMEKLATVEKKSPTPAEIVEESLAGDYVKLPERSKDPVISNDKEEEEEKSKDEKMRKKKKKKHSKSGDDKVDEKREKKKRKKSNSKNETLSEEKSKHGETPASSSTPIPPKTNFDLRDPTPYINALLEPQLAIEAPLSLRAEWHDPRNPIVSINNNPSIPLPYRIIAPKRDSILKPADMVFKMPAAITAPPHDITDLVQKRAKLMIELGDKPTDYRIQRKVNDIDRDLSAWAQSKDIPGRYTGRSGPRILSADELAPSNPRYNAWARKDLFVTAPEHDSPFGRRILEGLGWQQGVGLGRSLQGSQTPLQLDVKCDRKGLYAANESSRRRDAILDIDGKNPVSILMEFCAKHRLAPPNFTCIETGPSKGKQFLVKCTVDGVEYAPSTTSNNKKASKTQACFVVLQSLGLIHPLTMDC